MEICERMSKCSMEETLHQSSSCDICQSILRRSYGDLCLGSRTSDSASQIKQKNESGCTVSSSACKTCGKRKVQELPRCQEHQVEHTPNCGKGKKESEIKKYGEGKEECESQLYSKGESEGEGSEQDCFVASSLYHGGPDDLYDDIMRIKMKMEVKQLVEAMDPFNLEYAARGNWWEGSLYY